MTSVDLDLVRRVAALLNRDPAPLQEGAPLPSGWHFCLFSDETPQSLLRADGLGGLGFAMPELSLSRIVGGGMRVRFLHHLPIGARVHRESRILRVERKEGRSGPIAIVTGQHEISIGGAGEPAIVEEHDFVLTNAAAGASAKPQVSPTGVVRPFSRVRSVAYDPTMLFRFSALTFNSHRIHYDADYARDVEGYEGLLVNGGLLTLQIIEFFREVTGCAPSAVSIRNTGSLVCGRQAALKAQPVDDFTQSIWVEDENGLPVVEAKVSA